MEALYGGMTFEVARDKLIEAERRVRSGEPRAQIARDLGIAPSTLADWARRLGWRRKDLIAVRDEAQGKQIAGLIASLTAKERAKHTREMEKLRDAVEASRAELAEAAPDALLPGVLGEGGVPAQKLAMAMADTLLRQGQLADADKAVRLAVRFAEAEQSAAAHEETKLREERERLTKWWADKQTAYHKLFEAVRFIADRIVAGQDEEDARVAANCCPRCNRRMDFWPQEIDLPDEPEEEDAVAARVAAESDQYVAEFDAIVARHRARADSADDSGDFSGGESAGSDFPDSADDFSKPGPSDSPTGDFP